jgi:hypothetical protein
MKPGPYPAPSRHRWAVAVEFHDGHRIEGTSDEDVLERWARVATWGSETVLSPLALRRLVVQRCQVLTGTKVRASLPADRLLDALADAGVLWVIRK